MDINDITYYHKTPNMNDLKQWSQYLIDKPVQVPLAILSDAKLAVSDKLVFSVIISYLDVKYPYNSSQGIVANVNVDVIAITLHTHSAVVSKSIHHIRKVESGSD